MSPMSAPYTEPADVFIDTAEDEPAEVVYVKARVQKLRSICNQKGFESLSILVVHPTRNRPL